MIKKIILTILLFLPTLVLAGPIIDALRGTHATLALEEGPRGNLVISFYLDQQAYEKFVHTLTTTTDLAVTCPGLYTCNPATQTFTISLYCGEYSEDIRKDITSGQPARWKIDEMQESAKAKPVYTYGSGMTVNTPVQIPAVLAAAAAPPTTSASSVPKTLASVNAPCSIIQALKYLFANIKTGRFRDVPEEALQISFKQEISANAFFKRLSASHDPDFIRKLKSQIETSGSRITVNLLTSDKVLFPQDIDQQGQWKIMAMNQSTEGNVAPVQNYDQYDTDTGPMANVAELAASFAATRTPASSQTTTPTSNPVDYDFGF